MATPGADSFLLRSFREFYAVLSRVRGGISDGPWIASNRAVEGDDVIALREARATSIRTSLMEALEELDKDARRRVGDHGMASYREAKYVMVALADELLLDIDWEGREAWSKDLLESHAFGTHLAGERFFDRAAEILTLPREGGVDLATIYLLALTLGFRGRYRGHADPKPLKDLRRKLLSFVSKGDLSPFDPKRRLFPQAHAYTLELSEDLKLPPVGRWVGILVASLILWGVASHLTWNQASRPLSVANDSLAAAFCAAVADDPNASGRTTNSKCPPVDGRGSAP